MIRKLSLLCLALVLGAAWTASALAAGPEDTLIGYWPLDGDTLDESGLENHGTTEGNPIFEPGMYEEALYFDGNGDYLVIDSVADDFTNDDLTLSAWIKTADTGTWQWWFSCNTAGGGNVIILGLISGNIVVHQGSVQVTSDTVVNDLEWRHVAYSRIGSAGSLYINGEFEGTHTASFSLGTDNRWSIGQEWDGGSPGDFLDGTVDDVRIYDRGLTPEELPQIMTTVPPGAARDPNPEDEAIDVPRDVVLSWTPGKYAPAVNAHTVYFGENFDDVNDRVDGVVQSDNRFTPAERLDFETVYYWAVDEVNSPPDSTIFPGEVWRFETEPVGYPIDGNTITAIASSSSSIQGPPSATVDGSGLTGDAHSTDTQDMWLSETGAAQPAWIEYEFDRPYVLHQMLVWNSNTPVEAFVGLGFQDVTIEYSLDGVDFVTLGTTHQFAKASGFDDYTYNTAVDFDGAHARYVRLTANSNWGGVLAQFGLSEVRFLHIPMRARTPYPAQGAAAAPVDATLRWRAGREAAEHQVMIDADEQAVIDGTAAMETVMDAAFGPLTLDLNRTYYWKVDEVNAVETPAMLPANVWSFTTEDYRVVDDFESYTDVEGEEVFSTWADGFDDAGNGSLVGYAISAHGTFNETETVRSGGQAMPFAYDNTNGTSMSEATLTFAPAQDWTQHRIRTLTLWFSGAAGNTGRLYVTINGSKVAYEGDAADMQRGWQAWNIELAPLGVDLQRVTSLGIGVEGGSAQGTLLIDDIRLYPHAPKVITPVAPDDTGLIGYWKFDGDALDASGLGNDGNAVGDPIYEAGFDGQALTLDGADDYVEINSVAGHLTDDDVTLAGWVKTADDGSNYWFSCNSSTGDNVVLLGLLDGRLAIYDLNATEAYSSSVVSDFEWHHLAYTRQGTEGTLYVDGNRENTHVADFAFTDPQNRWSLGQEWDGDNASNFLAGTLDEVRMYDRGLSWAEMAGLAGRTQPFDRPFDE